LRYSYQTSRQTPIWILIGVNFLIFILGYVIPRFDSNPGSYLALQLHSLPLQPWSIFTSMFVHGGFSHIFFNMLTLFFFGTFLLQLISTGKFLLVYFIGGIVGNLLFLLAAYLNIGVNEYSIVVGASGAIYGIGGALVAMRPKVKVFVFPIPVPMQLWIAIIGGFLLTFFAYGIAWQAHLGGILAGLIAGFIFRRQERHRSYRI
jgi:membrane associated rhomboid family serine protease